MNERIKELIVAANDGLDGVRPGTQPMIDPSFSKFVEKFAELIVQECITTIQQDRFGRANGLETEYDDGYVDGMGYAERILKEHFGVQE